MSNDLRSYSSIASVARVAVVATAGGPVPVNQLWVFYYHAITRELRFIVFTLGNSNPMKRESQGTVKDASGNIILANYNETMSPLAATYIPSLDTIRVFYSDDQSLIRDVFTGDEGNTWLPGKLANMSLHAIDNHVITAYFDANADVTRLVLVDDNMLLHEIKEDGDGGPWSHSVVLP